MATPDEPLDFSRIVHATDFSQASEPAFDHALRLALGRRSHLYLVHAEHLEPARRPTGNRSRACAARWRGGGCCRRARRLRRCTNGSG